MSIEYSASAFFGTFAPRRSEVGEILARFIETGDGRTDNPEVVIDEVGSEPDGETFVVVRYRVGYSVSRLGDSPSAPVFLPPIRSEFIEGWLKRQGIDPAGMPQIGWHFAASVK
jgi:hypothetical protein